MAGIAKTNCIPMPERRQAGLCEVICRMNHSCKANAQYFWDDQKGLEVCYAIMDIPKGEEITVCYSEITSGRPLRHDVHIQHGFNCQCKACTTSSPEQLAQSDKNREELCEIIDETPTLLQTNGTIAIKRAKRSLELIKIEELFGLAPAQYYDGFQVAVAWGDQASAKA
ncbi:uncharacterized protein L201_000872 [Kwoniella dendrophila CBS 6074]|uniref:SET domain-containing protein n=1 Tax=Kwoniella dendrophila CBS 6074 TaxID=1295534 RepID=A0AAX4JLY7_9TREE